MSDIHIDDFFRDAAITLAQLYASFPRQGPLYVEDIAGPDTADDFGLHSQRHLACLGTLLWLAHEGYLSYKNTIREEGLDFAVLSHKSFTILCAPCSDDASRAALAAVGTLQEDLPPSIAQERFANISVMRHLIFNGTSGELRQFMNYLMNAARDH